MSFHPPSREDILTSSWASAMPAQGSLPNTDTRNYFQAIDNMISVFAIRPTDEVLFLTDPLLDRRVVDAISGIAKSRGVQPREFMAPSTQVASCPPEVQGLIEKATFVVSSWFCSVNDPLFIKWRRENGQRWVKITFFRNVDLWNTPQARFPLEIVGELIRATSRLYPEHGPFELRITDKRGTDFRVPFSADMRERMKKDNRWRGHNIADEAGLRAAHAKIAAALAGLPSKPRLEGADAMHAWVRVWCGQHVGWVDFDPTNAMLAGADHITIGHGRDYADISPIVGVLRTSGKHRHKQSVDVVRVDVELVAYGPGIGMLKADSAVGTRVDEALASGVKVVACENTMRGQKLTKPDMLAGVGYVPAGVVEIVQRQQQGWTYLRP